MNKQNDKEKSAHGDTVKPVVMCNWQRWDAVCGEDVNEWHTACGNDFTINEGTPKDNEMKFCCYCGKPINQIT